MNNEDLGDVLFNFSDDFNSGSCPHIAGGSGGQGGCGGAADVVAVEVAVAGAAGVVGLVVTQ